MASVGCKFHCLIAPHATTKLKKSKYYNQFQRDGGSNLSVNQSYGIIDTVNNKYGKYDDLNFVFYEEGLVLKERHFTDEIRDTIRTFTANFLKNECHGWEIGGYKIVKDTLYYDTKVGYKKHWSIYKGILFNDRIEVFYCKYGDLIDTTRWIIPKQDWRIVNKTIE